MANEKRLIDANALMNCCKNCKHSLPSSQKEFYFCLNSERNKNTDADKRFRRTQGINCPYCVRKESEA